MAAKRATSKTPPAGEALSIGGLSADAREAIAKAARKRDQPVEAWAAEALEDAARRTLDGGADTEVLAMLKRISDKLDRLSERPKPVETALDQVQKSVQELGSQVAGVYDEVRKRGSGTLDEVRSQTGSVVDDMSGRASETLSQWREAAGRAIGGLQQNLDEMRKTVFGAGDGKPGKKQSAEADSGTPAGTPAANSPASDGKPSGTAKAKAPAAGTRAASRAKPKSGARRKAKAKPRSR